MHNFPPLITGRFLGNGPKPQDWRVCISGANYCDTLRRNLPLAPARQLLNAQLISTPGTFAFSFPLSYSCSRQGKVDTTVLSLSYSLSLLSTRQPVKGKVISTSVPSPQVVSFSFPLSYMCWRQGKANTTIPSLFFFSLPLRERRKCT